MLNNSQFIKLFGRRFVANTVRNSCRCPKCRSEYSYNYDVADKYGKDQFILSNRPVLLPCGHNMCENCVYHNRQNLTCTTCLKPIEISLDLDPTQEVKFNVRDHFDMNFYLMGELNTLRQHRNNFSSNNSMSGTNRDAGGATSSVIKCIECELVPSIGKCRQCKVYLCKRCFDAVHKNSKVLKMHTMQRYDHDKNKSNVMRFMKPQYCKRHQNIINRYCTKCDLFCCYDCAKHDHAQHKCTTLLEENNKLMPDISETLGIIQTSRENLKKGQKDIKSVEIQLEEYASKTMEDISNYFLQLHSFLQNEEREITEKFSEMCQQPQLNLREANIKLNESQDKLNSMRSNLEYYQHKPPTDFHLGKLLKVYCEQLQDVPNNIQITKPRSNPFHFEIKQDIRQYIRKCFEYSYNDPTILFKMDVSSESAPSLADSTTLSSINRTSNTTDTNYQQQQKPQQKFKNKSKNNKKPQKKKHSQQANNPLPIVNKPTISDDDISLPSRGLESFAASVHRPQPSATEENTVRVTYIKSPEHFYVQNVNDVQKIRELSHSYLTGALGNRIPEVISEGYYYMAYHTTDKQWYRSMLKKIVNDEVYKIFLVDFGMHLEVSKEKLCDIDKKHLKIPFAAIRCAIYDIMPVGNQWAEVANGLLVELLQNSPARMSIIEKINDEMLKIDLQTVHTKSVRDSFLYTGLARERPGVFSFKMQIKTAFPTTKIEDRIPKNIINMTDMVFVTVLNIEGPQEFYVIKNELIDSKKQFVKDLNEFYAAAQSDKLQQIYLATTQMCCVIYLKDIWHRAVIEEINYKGQLTVRLVDEGRCELINWRQAFVLNTKFRKTSEFSIRCSLADLEPLQENGYIYTQTAIQDFKQMCTNPLLKMELQAIKQNEYKVILYISKKKMDINIGAALVRNKHGISTGVATQVTEYAKTPNPRLSLPQNLSNETLSTALQLHIHSAKPHQVTMSDNLSFAKNKEVVNPTQSSSTSSKQPQQPPQVIKILKRTLIEIAHFINPGEFYIQLASLSRGTKRFHQNIQDAQSKKYPADQLPPPQENREWFMENHCLVYTKYYSSKVVINPNDIPLADCEWYRGIITNIHYLPGEEPKFSVFLRDIGATICSIASQQLFSIDPQLDRVTNAVYRCHLACIEPAAGGKIWSGAAIDDFLSMTSKFETLSVTLQGKRCPERNSLPIVLWGSKTETTDPLAPCTTKYSNINRALVRHGLAYVVDRLDVTQQFDQIEEMECAEGEISLEEWFKAFSDNALLKVIERNELELPSILRKSGVSAADDNLNSPDTEDNPLNIHLTEFDYKYTTNQNAPPAWLTSKVITKTIFTGIPTYIDFDCMVYLNEADDRDFLLKLNKEINKTYGNLPPPSADYVYKIGQPCLTKYHLDQKFYRGIVKELNGPNELSIQFVDYGNIELVQTKDVRPYAPYPNLPALVNKYIIDGIKPKGGATAYDVNDLDQMHKLIVTKFVSVRIPVSELSNTIKRCCLRIGNMDMACEFVERGLAEADYATNAAATSASSGNTSFKMRRNLNPIPSEPPVEDYDVFNQDINMSIQHLHHLVIDEEDDDDDVDEVAEDTLLVDTDDDATKFDHLNEMIQRLDKNTNMAAQQLLTKATTTAGTISTTSTTGLNNQPPPPKKRMFNDDDYTQMMSGMAFDTDNINENFDDDGLGDKAFCVDYDDCDDDVVELEAKLDLNYWHGVGEDMLEEEEKEISQQLEMRASYQEERDIESEFDGFHPNETSTVFSHFSGIEFFKMPQLPAAMHHFKCRVNSMLTATVLQIFPHHTEFRYREVELQRLIKQLVKSAPMLAQFEPRTICLARYTMDKKWYRALIRSYNPAAKTVDVLYADYMNSETLPVKYIRQCPADLLGWPLRTFRVRLHGIKPNPNIKDHEIRVALYKLLAKRTLFAVVKKHPNNRGSVQGLDAISSSLANNDLMEVALYESQEVSLKGITIYEPLIDNQYFQRI